VTTLAQEWPQLHLGDNSLECRQQSQITQENRGQTDFATGEFVDRIKDIFANSTRLITSRIDTTRSTCRAHAFWLCWACQTGCLTGSTQPKCMGSTHRSSTAQHARHDYRSTGSTSRTCRVETWRAKWNFGYTGNQLGLICIGEWLDTVATTLVISTKFSCIETG